MKLGIIRGLKKLDRKFGWYIIGFIGTIVTIYSVVHDKRPNVEFVINSKYDVIEIKEKMDNIGIQFNGEKIDTNNYTLKLITFKVINEGDKSISKGDYDTNNLIGFKIFDAKLVEYPKMIDYSNNYIRDNLVISKKNDNEFLFSDILFEKKSFYIIKCLLLAKRDSNIKIIPTGKILDQDTIKIIDENQKKENNLFELVFSGNILIHFLRAVIYLIGLIVFFIFLAKTLEVLEKLSKSFNKKKREKIVEKIIIRENVRNFENTESILKIYKTYDLYILKQLYRLITNEEEKNRYIESIKTNVELKEMSLSECGEPELWVKEREIIEIMLELFQEFIGKGKIIVDGYIVDKKLIEELSKIIDMIETIEK